MFFRCIIPVVFQAIRERVGYVKTQPYCILICYADDHVGVQHCVIDRCLDGCIVNYARYVYDILLIYDSLHTDIVYAQ